MKEVKRMVLMLMVGMVVVIISSTSSSSSPTSSSSSLLRASRKVVFVFLLFFFCFLFFSCFFGFGFDGHAPAKTTRHAQKYSGGARWPVGLVWCTFNGARVQFCTFGHNVFVFSTSGMSEGAPDDRRLPEGLRGLIKLEEA